jgi:four helix bundle protein
MQRYLFPFEKLDVWQLTVDLAETVLSLIEKLPQNKHIRLISQIESAAVSPAQNTCPVK